MSGIGQTAVSYIDYTTYIPDSEHKALTDIRPRGSSVRLQSLYFLRNYRFVLSEPTKNENLWNKRRKGQNKLIGYVVTPTYRDLERIGKIQRPLKLADQI